MLLSSRLPQAFKQPEEPEPPSDLKIVTDFIVRLYSRYSALFLIAANLLVTGAAILIYDASKPAPQRLTQGDIDTAVGRTLDALPPKPSDASVAYEAIRPSLVSILVTGSGTDKTKGGSLGSGVVISDTGLILTCLHVVKSATQVNVIFADGSQSTADVIQKEPDQDLAVLQPATIPDDLKPATLVSASLLHVGDEVVAVGDPFGILSSASAGVVSGLKRSFTSKESGATLANLIQFDAAVNPGNSGGPLVDRDGEVVGIVTALLNPTGQDVFIGIGFAIPLESAAGMIGSPPY